METKQHLVAPVVVITRAKNQSAGFESALRQRGLETFHLAVIETKTATPSNEISATFFELFAERFDWILFSSENGVTHFERYLESAGLESNIPESTNIAVVGDKTDNIVRTTFGRYADKKPAKFEAQGLLEAFNAAEINAKKILIVRGDKGKDILAQGLAKMGALVSELTLYQTLLDQSSRGDLEKLLTLDPARIIFTFFSPSAVSGSIEILGKDSELLKRVKIASIGGVTSQAVEAAGYKVWLEASKPSEGILALEIQQALK